MDCLDSLRLSPGDALFLDFDGTLAEIGPDPAAIRLEDGMTATLADLAARLGGALAILSGRSLRDLAARTPSTVWRVGAHGLEVAAPGAETHIGSEPPPERVLAPLRRVEAAFGGVTLEMKGGVVALHYRAEPTAKDACIEAARQAAAAVPGYVVQQGKMVVEVKPEAANKGESLKALCAAPPFAGRRPVMIGDDATDEDAIGAALALGGVGVKVGAGETAAPLRAADPGEVRAWLRREASGNGISMP